MRAWLSSRSIAALTSVHFRHDSAMSESELSPLLSLLRQFDKNSEKWAYVLQADPYNKLSDAKELTFGLPPTRLGRADASIALRSLLRRFRKRLCAVVSPRVLSTRLGMPSARGGKPQS